MVGVVLTFFQAKMLALTTKYPTKTMTFRRNEGPTKLGSTNVLENISCASSPRVSGDTKLSKRHRQTQVKTPGKKDINEGPFPSCLPNDRFS